MFADLPKPFFVLAPMDDVTDVVFRQIIEGCSPPDLYMTEFVNVDGLQSVGRERLLPRLKKAASERRLIAQLWGKTPDNYYKTAQECIEMGFIGIDINMGCPDKTVVKNGCCSAFIQPQNRERAIKIIKAVQAAADGRVPVSVKTRLGFNEIDYSWHELLLKQNINMLTIHGRTRKQMSKVPADWSKIQHIVELRNQIAPHTLIVGNGDVKDRSHGLELAKTYGVDGVMIGRGVFADPYCFAGESPWAELAKADKLNMFRKHLELFKEVWPNNERRFDTIKKFAKIYINGFADASALRQTFMECRTMDDLLLAVQQAQSDL